ncbi:MAG: ATP-binding protein [Polyangiaceae bacterium]|nr:ATP-binding protein [Polyangiaceae bacterium]
MRIPLGLPENIANATLPRRLAWLTAARMVFLLGALGLVGLVYLGRDASLESFSVRVALLVLGSSFSLAGLYAALLRRGRNIERLASAQLIFDQLTWTMLVYISGGASSGAVSFYGLTCVTGAALTGFRGAAVATAAGGIGYATLLGALQLNWLVPPPDQPVDLYQLSRFELLYHVLLNVLALMVVTILAGYLAERLRITGGKLVQAEERAEQAERMAALGRLAAGLAHEIRNPLGSIAGSISLLKTANALSAEDQQLCIIIEREAARLNDLVTDMMELSKPKKPQRVDVDLVAIARDVVTLTANSGRGVSDVRVRYAGAEHAEVNADPAQLRQMIWNLVRNAVQASNAGDEVIVEVRLLHGAVELVVEDHGMGIDDVAKERIFDAFFTTRSKGTGVGLAVVKRIVDEHGFEIAVESKANRGAVFRITLPVTGSPVPLSNRFTFRPSAPHPSGR